MSGHSKWAQIKHKKGAADAKKGALFTKHGKLIAIAAKKGGDPAMNPALRLAIDNARQDNMPGSNIERAIKRGSGEDKEGAEIHEVFYEAYGPAGIALYIHCLTDNKNRTVSSLKTTLNKHNGRMAELGSVSWMFEQKGLIRLRVSPQEKDDLELFVIDAGASDIESLDECLEVYSEPSQLPDIKKKLEDKRAVIESAEITYISKNVIPVTDKDISQKILDLLSVLEEDEDVTNVYSNFDISGVEGN